MCGMAMGKQAVPPEGPEGLCLCSAWQGASSDSEQRCHWLHISAGDLGQCWKWFSDASIPEATAACVAMGVCPSSQHSHQQ